MKRLIVGCAVAAALSLLARVPDALGQAPCQAPETSIITAGAPVAGTARYVKVALGNRLVGSATISPAANLDTISGADWTPTQAQAGLIAAANPATRVLLYYRDGDTTGCVSSVALPGPAQTSSASAAVEGHTTTCQGAASRMEQAERRNARGGLTGLVFDSNGNLCDYNRDYGVVGDPIYVGIVTPINLAWDAVQFQNCAIEPEGPRLFVGTGGFPGGAQGAAAAETLLVFGPRRCFNTAVDIVLRQTGPGAREQRFSLNQYQRYEGTLQFGAIFSPRHDHTFGLRSDTGSVKRILDQGPTGDGVEYMATVVLYGLPKQLLRALRSSAACDAGACVRGRDIVHDNGVLDRIGGLLGMSLSNPGRRFIAGFTFEVTSGVSAMWAYEYARVNSLHGVSPDSVFAGAASDIPTSDSWKSGWVWGISLDLRYVTALFSRL